nr:putative reverse transcriptase domain-containing protein [Tanacetum cinerariifolium]
MINVGNQNTNEVGQNVKCNRCGMKHYENCPIKCNKCGKIGHKARDCWTKVVATGENAQPVVTCYGCGEKGHIKTNCPVRNNPGRGGARRQAYALRDGDQNLGPNVVTEPVEIIDREVKMLKQSRILIVKVCWNSRRGPEFTWEREDLFRSKYPQLFARRRVTRQDKRWDVAS